MEKTDWITELNKETGKLERIGLKVKWTDDLKNTYMDDLYFQDTEDDTDDTVPIRNDNDNTVETDSEEPSQIKKDARQKNKHIIGGAILFVWRNGNGQPLQFCPSDSAFAIPDLDLSVLSLAIQIRQIQSTLTFAATNPFFYHLKYGDAINPTQRKALLAQMGYVSVSKGIGAKSNILEEIVSVENGSVEKCVQALDSLISFYAATTRLPLSFYFGEKQIGSGLDSGGAEEQDADDVMSKKEYILQHFADQLTELASTYWGIQLPDLYNFYATKKEEAEAEAKVEKEAELEIINGEKDEEEEDETDDTN
jgi:hypothetical protein